MKKVRQFLLLGAAIATLTVCPAMAAEKVLLDFNSASGNSLPGWTWRAPTTAWTAGGQTMYGTNNLSSPGNAGWTSNSGGLMRGSWFPRTFAVNGYGANETATIDTVNNAPGSTGGALKVIDSGLTSIYRVGWWYLWGENFNTRSLADATTNRLDFYIKTHNMAPLKTTGGFQGYGNMHVGTYLCWPSGGLGGASCPTEADNQHYYHYLLVENGGWLHVQLDPQPTHQRGNSGYQSPPLNPPADGVHNYFQHMNGFYIEMVQNQSNPTAYWIDEMKTWTQTQPENDRSISSVWVGYWPERTTGGKWQLGFQDCSISPDLLGRGVHSTFEVRYSTSPITNENFGSATPITPEVYASTKNTGAGRIERTTIDTKPVLTRFAIPDATVQGADRIYFAIKDVSSVAAGNGQNAPNSRIKTIDYALKTVRLSPPSNLRFQ